MHASSLPGRPRRASLTLSGRTARAGRALVVLLATTALVHAPAAASGPPIQVRVSHLTAAGPVYPECGEADKLFQDAEVEPHIAVSPTDPKHLLAAWQQNKTLPTGAQTVLVAVSRNAGRSWEIGEVAGLSQCTGGVPIRVSDPSVSIAADGSAYLATLAIHGSGHGIQVSRSSDGGRTWAPPVTLAPPRDGHLIDIPNVVADRVRPGVAHATWTEDTILEPTGFGPTVSMLMYSRSDDGGRSWTAPTALGTTSAFQFFMQPKVVALADGSVVIAAIEANPSTCNAFGTPHVEGAVVVTRSADGGRTWSARQAVGSSMHLIGLDPDDGSCAHISAFPTPSLAAGPDGDVFLAWHDIRSTTEARILMVRSEDSGATWTPPLPIVEANGYQAFTQTLAVDHRGRLAVTWYDFRGDVVGDEELTTDAWFASSTDDGATWTEAHLFGPFDYRKALQRLPDEEFPEYMLGDYFGMVALRNGFGAVLGVAPPIASAGPSDILFVHTFPF